VSAAQYLSYSTTIPIQIQTLNPNGILAKPTCVPVPSVCVDAAGSLRIPNEQQLIVSMHACTVYCY
jgi:hypothetical protein